VQADLFHADRQTEMTKPVVAFRSFAKACKNRSTCNAKKHSCRSVCVSNKHIEVHLLDVIILSHMKMHGKHSIKFMKSFNLESG
jgi:hypothetical protein